MQQKKIDKVMAFILLIFIAFVIAVISTAHASEQHYYHGGVPLEQTNTINIYNVKSAVEACASGAHDFVNSTDIQVSISSCFKNNDGAYSVGVSTLFDDVLVKGFITPSDSGDMIGISGKWTFKNE